MDWKCNEYENFTDLADEDRITALLLCEALNLNFEYLYNFDKFAWYGELSRYTIRTSFGELEIEYR